MRTGNPALQGQVFNQTLTMTGQAGMTVQGTVNKSFFLLALLLLAALWPWTSYFSGQTAAVGPMIWAGLIGGFVLAMVVIFKKTWAPVLAPIYALLEGLFLGGISAIMEAQYPGIVLPAVGLTFATLLAMLVAYRTGLIKASENFKLGVVAATAGIAVFYFISIILGFFGIQVPLINSGGLFGILFSLFVVTIAALNLVLDFDFIEQGSQQGAPKYMEWYGAFALMVTLVWLYLEILRLLAKLRQR